MLNDVKLIGHVGKDPEDKTKYENKIAKFSIATNYMKNGQKCTDWHSVTAFGKTAEIALSFIRKGDLVLISGRINYSKYIDDAGITRKNVEIIASRVHNLNTKNNNVSNDESNTNDNKDYYTDDDIPF
jgi:single-strand DNA-binding protein